MRRSWVVLHELAHLVTPGHLAAHGPEFARNYHTLVEEILGAEAAAALLRSFETHNVEVTPAQRVTLRAA
jgi:putative metallohydrolase (TIGR04338 family)